MILLRETVEEDIQDIYEHINLNYVKKYYTDHEEQWEQHRRWYKFLINSDSYVLYTLIDSKDNSFLGYVKFEFEDEECAMINVYLAQNIRNQGHSYDIIRMSIEELKLKKPDVSIILAYILEENVVSVKAFKKLNFQCEGIEEYNGIDHLLYIKML